MSFITLSETNILMDVGPIPADWLRRFRDVGVQTCLQFSEWGVTEPERGRYDWRAMDEMVERTRAGGLKVLLLAPGNPPAWAPDDWFAHTADHRPLRSHLPGDTTYTWACLSPWCDEAMQYLTGYMAQVCARYSAADVLPFLAFSRDGESILPPAANAFYDRHALASYRGWVGSVTAVPGAAFGHTWHWLRESLVPIVTNLHRAVCDAHPSRTVILSLHTHHSQFQGSGMYGGGIRDYFAAIQDQVRPAALWANQFTHFPMANERYQLDFLAWLHARNIFIMAGGEWPEGLRENTPKAIAQGIRVILTAPVHGLLKRTQVEQWHVDAVGESVKRMRTSLRFVRGQM